MEYCLSHGIAVTAYGSLGGSHNKAQSNAVAEVARIHGVTSAQACLVPRPGPAVEPATLCSVAVPGARIPPWAGGAVAVAVVVGGRGLLATVAPCPWMTTLSSSPKPKY